MGFALGVVGLILVVVEGEESVGIEDIDGDVPG